MNIRRFRSAIARLKKAGLVNPEIDARGVKPSRALNAAVKRYADVITGTAKAVPLRKLDTSEKIVKQKTNYQIAAPKNLPKRVIVPHFPDEKVKVKRGLIEYHSVEGIRRIELPHYSPQISLKKYFGDLKRRKFPDLPKGHKFAARFFSGRTRTYSSIQDLINKVSGYESIRRAKSEKAKLDIIRNFEIVVTPHPREFKKRKNDV